MEHVRALQPDSKGNQKKIIEVCHVGKFLMLLGKSNSISRLTETPDFIVSADGELVGLEHQIVIDAETKEREGFIENIFSIAEDALASECELPNFLANCYLRADFSYRLSDKTRLIDEVKTVVRHYIKTKVLIDNSIIERIGMMGHSRKSINPNLGPWWQKSLTTDLLMSAILKKEKKLTEYLKKTSLKQWLLLVIGGINGSSYIVSENLEFTPESQFDKIYLLEDFSERLYEIK